MGGEVLGEVIGGFIGKYAGKIGGIITNNFIENKIIDPSAEYVFNKTFTKTLVNNTKAMKNKAIKCEPND
jgi:hypothetical protein